MPLQSVSFRAAAVAAEAVDKTVSSTAEARLKVDLAKNPKLIHDMSMHCTVARKGSLLFWGHQVDVIHSPRQCQLLVFKGDGTVTGWQEFKAAKRQGAKEC